VAAIRLLTPSATAPGKSASTGISVSIQALSSSGLDAGTGGVSRRGHQVRSDSGSEAPVSVNT